MQWPLCPRLLLCFSLVSLVTASPFPDLNSVSAPLSPLNRRDIWPYAVIGDSWGSGIAYDQDVLLDDNLDHCLRSKESYGALLEADNSWLGGFQSGLHDAACSGSRLVDLVQGEHQVGKVGNPNLIIMTSGGNNAGFGDVLDACVYHPNPTKNYGPAYADDKDKSGACAKALGDADDYVSNTLKQDLVHTINDIFADPTVKDNPNFLLYLTGYAQSFGTSYDPWCNNEAWNIVGVSPKPYLSTELRQALNSRTQKLNQIYKDTITTKFADRARFVDLDAGFSGHRFCEAGATHDNQFSTDTESEKVYFWNLNWPWQVSKPDVGGFVDGVEDLFDGEDVNADKVADLFDGNGVTPWSGISGSGSGSGSASNDPVSGWRLRPFHPRLSGYRTIKNAIIDQLKKDGLPKA